MAKIVLDAGHGGSGKYGDPGAVNGKQLEKDYTLALAKKVYTKLKAKGHQVVMTRSTDRVLSLQQRCTIANNADCDAFVSIHLNSSTNKNANGIETWKYPRVGGISKRLAENVQSALIRYLPTEKNRGVKEEMFYVLKNTKMPAILIEAGFLSHKPTADKFNSYYYQDRIAEAICEGICKSFA